MKVLLVFALACVAIASARGVDKVHVVDNNPHHHGVQVVDIKADPVHVVDNNPSAVHVVDNNPHGVHVVDNNNPDQTVIPNPDPFFYQGGQGPAGRPDISPEYVNNNRPYVNNYDNPYLRSGSTN